MNIPTLCSVTISLLHNYVIHFIPYNKISHTQYNAMCIVNLKLLYLIKILHSFKK